MMEGKEGEGGKNITKTRDEKGILSLFRDGKQIPFLFRDGKKIPSVKLKTEFFSSLFRDGK